MSHGGGLPSELHLGGSNPLVLPAKGPVRALARLLAWINRAMVFLGMVALLCASLILTYSVFSRYVFKAATDWQAVVSRKDIDLVDIVTPGDSHHEIAIAAAKAGKAVFCEKPLANTVSQAEAMLAAVRSAGVPNMVCHNYRRAPAVMLARQLIEQGTLGRLFHFRGTYLQDWIVDPKFPRVWRLDRDRAGAGALGDIASHVIDLARFLVGEIAEVTACLDGVLESAQGA